MATGDVAAAAGLPVVPSTKDIRQGYDDINALADKVGEHLLSGGHTWAAITGKPATFPPSAHTHPWSDVGAATALPITRGGTGGTSASAARDLLGLKQAYDAVAASTASGVPGALARFSTEVGTSGLGTIAVATPVSDLQAANKVYVDVTPSSLRYKTDVAPWDLDPAALLSIEPKTFTRTHTGQPVPDVGAIAEDLDDAGLTDLVVYDDQHRPDAILDRRMVWALLAVARHQAAQIAALTTRLDALEG